MNGKTASIKKMILGIAVMLFGGFWMLSVSGELRGVGFPVLLVGLIIVVAGFFQKDQIGILADYAHFVRSYNSAARTQSFAKTMLCALRLNTSSYSSLLRGDCLWLRVVDLP